MLILLKEIRREKKLTQKDVAECVGISQPALSNIESGKRRPSINTAKSIARVLGCTLDDLLRESIKDQASLNQEQAI